MALKIRQVPEMERPKEKLSGKVNQDIEQLKGEIAKLGPGTMLEVDAGDEKRVRSVKNLITRASRQVNVSLEHWHVGSVVFAKHAAAGKRGRPPKETGAHFEGSATDESTYET